MQRAYFIIFDFLKFEHLSITALALSFNALHQGYYFPYAVFVAAAALTHLLSSSLPLLNTHSARENLWGFLTISLILSYLFFSNDPLIYVKLFENFSITLFIFYGSAIVLWMLNGLPWNDVPVAIYCNFCNFNVFMRELANELLLKIIRFLISPLHWVINHYVEDKGWNYYLDRLEEYLVIGVKLYFYVMYHTVILWLILQYINLYLTNLQSIALQQNVSLFFLKWYHPLYLVLQPLIDMLK